MFKVNNIDVSGMNHTEVVNLVRAAPKVVDLVVGRVLEQPKPPIEAHLLPDITFQCYDESLGNERIKDIITLAFCPNPPGKTQKQASGFRV